MPIAAVAIAAVGLGLSVYQTVDAKNKQKKAEKEAKEYERQKLTNPYENLQVSTRGSDLQQENLNTQVSTMADGIRSGGSRAIIGGIPTLYDNIIKSNQQIAANLDQQENQNQQLEAQGNAMVQNMNEQRERDDLLGIGNAINTYQQDYNNGLTNTVQSGLALASAGSNIKSGSSINNTNAVTTQKQPSNAIQNNLYNGKPQSAVQSYLRSTDPYQNQLDQYNRTLYRRRF